jgi:hypothetical protein
LQEWRHFRPVISKYPRGYFANTYRDEEPFFKNHFALLLALPIKVAELEPLGAGAVAEASDSSGRDTVGKQYPKPRYQASSRYILVASRPKPKKIKIMNPAATEFHLSKNTTPYVATF